MEEEKDKKNKMWNEMSDAEKMYNLRSLQAYEQMDHQTGNKMLPGFEDDPWKNKMNHARFNRENQLPKKSTDLPVHNEGQSRMAYSMRGASP